MNTKIHYRTNVALGAFLLVFSQLVWSLGLGEAKIESFLGQPLVANIELISRPTEDLSSVSASQASAADYELIGASRDDISVPLQFSIENQGGQAYIAVRSRLAVDNPIVRLILEVNWPRGRMLREYTLFLDPPTFSQPAPAPRIETGRETRTQPTPAAGIEAEQTIEAQPSTSIAPLPSESTSAATPDDSAGLAGDDFGPVQSGDTLWRIAMDWSAGSELNLNKVMLAIQRQNPQAFSNNNINLLQRGAILRMPQMDEVNSLSSAAASAEVQVQSEAFQSRRSRPAQSASVPLIAEESVAMEPVESDQIAPEPLEEDESLAAEPAPSQLELLPPSEDNFLDNTSGFEESEAGVDDAASPQALRARLGRKEEELINQRQQNAYLEQRLEELESQLAQSREGTVEDSELASMEERLRQERLSDEQAAVPKVVSIPADEKTWYEGFPLWLLGLMVAVAVVVGWLMSRRGGSDTVVSDLGGGHDSLREIKDEAEDVLRVLHSTAEETVVQEKAGQQEDDAEVTAAEPAETAIDDSDDTQDIPAGNKPVPEDEDAHVLDEESADPEIQLNLARAYVSMGDKEAARVILEEVITNGTEEQQAEANKMKNLL